MKILAADSASVSAAAAVYADGKIFSEGFINNGLTHSQTLMPLIDSTVKYAGLDYGDIDLFAVTTGPGSFTGVRIGVATVKGLAFSADKPCVSVSALEAIAMTAAGFSGIICAAMDARRNQVYNGVFGCCDGKLTRLCDDRAIAVPDLLEELYANYPDSRIFAAGDGGHLVCSADTSGKIVLVPESVRFPRAGAIAQIAAQSAAAGNTLPCSLLNPVYLRPSQAEREARAGNACQTAK